MKGFNVKNIVIPTDFSKISFSAFEYAKEIGFMYKAKLNIVHVIEDAPPVFPNEAQQTTPENLLPALEEEALRRLDSAKEDLGQITGLQIETFLRKGIDHEEIINFAKEINAELIVIATHGRSGVMQTLLGSVAQRVIKNAKCPVLVTTPDEND